MAVGEESQGIQEEFRMFYTERCNPFFSKKRYIPLKHHKSTNVQSRSVVRIRRDQPQCILFYDDVNIYNTELSQYAYDIRCAQLPFIYTL